MKRILIVDDSLTSRMILLRCLDMAGLGAPEILQAKNGREALEMAHAKPPDLIIADLNMPLMSGEDLLAALKAHPVLKDKPVLIVSSALNPPREARLAALGAVGTVMKPISPSALRSALRAYLDAKGEG